MPGRSARRRLGSRPDVSSREHDGSLRRSVWGMHSAVLRRKARWSCWLTAWLLLLTLFPAFAAICVPGAHACRMASTRPCACCCAVPAAGDGLAPARCPTPGTEPAPPARLALHEWGSLRAPALPTPAFAAPAAPKPLPGAQRDRSPNVTLSKAPPRGPAPPRAPPTLLPAQANGQS